jgi:hypothetical protein
VTDPRLRENELDRLVGDLAAGRTPSEPYELPREEIDAVTRFRSWAMTPPPDAARERVWREVLVKIERQRKEQSMVTSITRGRLAPPPPIPLRPRPDAVGKPVRTSRGRLEWSNAVSIIAALLLLAGIVGGWMAAGSPRPWGDEHPHALIPAPLVTPEATPDPATYEGVLIDTILTKPPAKPNSIHIELADYGTGANTVGGCLASTVFASFVVQGELTGSVTGPPGMFAQVIRGVGGPAEDLASGASFHLTAGDTLAAGAGASYITEHAPGPPAVTIGFAIYTADSDTCGPSNTTAGISELGLGYGTYPPGPLHLVVRRVLLAPSDTFEQPKTEGQIVVLGHEDPFATFPMSGSKATNTTDKPVSLLVMTLDPVAGAATPEASPSS